MRAGDRSRAAGRLGVVALVLGLAHGVAAEAGERLGVQDRYEQARANYEARAWEAAKADLEHVVVAEPRHDEAWTLLGGACLALGRAREAVAAYERAVALGEARAGEWSNLGTAQMHAGRTDAAIHSLRRALRLEPMDEIARSNLSIALGLRAGDLAQAGRLGDATATYREAWSLDPANLDLRFELGHLHARQGHWSEAARAFRAIHVRRLYDADTLSNLVLCYVQLGRWRAAADMNDALARLEPAQARRFQEAIDARLSRRR